MYHDAPIFELRGIRRSDTNSLLRMYDLARGIFTGSALQQERARADKAIQRLVKELRKRNVSVAAVMPAPSVAGSIQE